MVSQVQSTIKQAAISAALAKAGYAITPATVHGRKCARTIRARATAQGDGNKANSPQERHESTAFSFDSLSAADKQRVSTAASLLIGWMREQDRAA